MKTARTPLAAFGVVLTTACALLFLIALGAESYGLIQNPYVGILIFFALPAGFLLGLLLVLVGNLRGEKRGAETISWPTRAAAVAMLVFTYACWIWPAMAAAAVALGRVGLSWKASLPWMRVICAGRRPFRFV